MDARPIVRRIRERARALINASSSVMLSIRISGVILSMVRKILRFIKVEHTAFSLPLLLTGAWMGAGYTLPQSEILLAIALAAIGARTFGMSFNRIFDRRIDAQNPRTAGRELPSGAMSVRLALGIALGGLLLYLSACVFLGAWCLALSPLPLIPLMGYSFLKRYTALCHFGIGLCLALAPLGAYVAAAGQPYFSVQVLLFSSFVFFWLSGADIIYALLDLESDRRNGIHSLPAALGAAGAQTVAAAVHLTALLILGLLLYTRESRPFALAAFAATAVLFVMMYLPFIPVPKRFFPIATLAGVAGAITPLLM
ncbi:MAG: 4-hydroxybenzoate octaprenyltransferase [Desulfobacteraceae bacterium]|nr:MAG: 4-hydroxybenzoate octaprenyltransferase [Desulfobacteraceae bacterium]